MTDEQPDESDQFEPENQPDPDINIAVTMTKEEPDGPTPQASFFNQQKDYAEKVSERAVAALDGARGRGDIWGKSVLALGTTLVTGLGVGTLVTIFPIKDWYGVGGVVVAIVAFAVAVWGVITVGNAVTSIGEPIVMETDMDTSPEYGGQVQVKKIYDRFAKVNGATTLDEYSREALVIERIRTELEKHGDDWEFPEELKRTIIRNIWKVARKKPIPRTVRDQYDQLHAEVTNKETRDDALKRAAAIRAEVRATMNSASVALARHKVVSTIKEPLTIVALAAIPLGLVVALMAADFVRSNGTGPKELIESNKACVELVEAARKQGMVVSDGCKKVELPPTQTPPSKPQPADPVQEARSKALASLVDQYNKCITNPELTPPDRLNCDNILNLQVAVPAR
ncbi:hypothetical protein [Williamsia sp. DF01-3]|uniref:hypothetical protein n=1 Tax=Williamsia sp. DF01-3 TaxID=2934157 RepID=UPI001FF66B16|nr:hypothetical protein [Williamsia sp. DF01-3]MCK0519309.1 hypothetical protein [Williamsia sp. DF01-3]